MNSTTKLLVASIRNASQLKDAVINGADVITIPPKTWTEVYDNKYTKMGENDFNKSWKELNISLRKKYENIK